MANVSQANFIRKLMDIIDVEGELTRGDRRVLANQLMNALGPEAQKLINTKTASEAVQLLRQQINAGLAKKNLAGLGELAASNIEPTMASLAGASGIPANEAAVSQVLSKLASGGKTNLAGVAAENARVAAASAPLKSFGKGSGAIDRFLSALKGLGKKHTGTVAALKTLGPGFGAWAIGDLVKNLALTGVEDQLAEQQFRAAVSPQLEMIMSIARGEQVPGPEPTTPTAPTLGSVSRGVSSERTIGSVGNSFL